MILETTVKQIAANADSSCVIFWLHKATCPLFGYVYSRRSWREAERNIDVCPVYCAKRVFLSDVPVSPGPNVRKLMYSSQTTAYWKGLRGSSGVPSCFRSLTKNRALRLGHGVFLSESSHGLEDDTSVIFYTLLTPIS